jgi:hypothetical protein
MGLSRRQFTKEFKLAAVRRLEQGISIAEAADFQESDQRFQLKSINDCSLGDHLGAKRRWLP